MSEISVKQTEISVAKMEVEVERIQADLLELKNDVKAMRATLDRAEGGWKTIMIIGGISAAIGSFVTKVITLWPFGK